MIDFIVARLHALQSAFDIAKGDDKDNVRSELISLLRSLHQSAKAEQLRNQEEDKPLDFAVHQFMSGLSERMKSLWQPPRDESGIKLCTVEFWIMPDGDALLGHVSKSSGKAVVDKSCTDAMRKLHVAYPDTADRKGMFISFDFNYRNVGIVDGSQADSKMDVEDTRRLLKQQIAVGGRDNVAHLEALLQLSSALAKAEDFESAKNTVAQAEQVATRCHCGSGEQLALRRHAYEACALEKTGHSEEAEKLFEVVLPQLEANATGCPQEYRSALQIYAKYLYKHSRIDEANKLYEKLKKMQTMNSSR